MSMTLMMLTFLIRSPIWILSGSICAAEKDMRPSAGVGSVTGGMTRLSKSSTQTMGPMRFPLPARRRPPMFRPQAFLKGAVVPQLARPKEIWTPTLKWRFSSSGISRSSRKCGSRCSAVSPDSSASMRTSTVPLPRSGRAEPGSTLSRPSDSLSVCPMNTSPSSDVKMSMLYGFGFRHVTLMLSPTWMLLSPSSSLSRVAACTPHSVAV
mmetsp:Transcript_67878/g.178024  ORF Transcript_67878/g.178024 Transcript_67878/m.178024 type:complete len:209 (-) Transcript_67878:488-1114(-)